jgi:hypothetical protein
VWSVSAVIARHRALVVDPELGAAIDVLVRRFDDHTAELLPALPRSVIHGDLNDYNVLVGGGSDLFDRCQHVTGIIDFGDMVHGVTIGDLAIAIAYAVLDATDPLSVMWQMVHGYHGVRTMAEIEMHAVFGLVVLRLCLSACLAAHQQRDHPDNLYLGISQAPVRRMLPRLARIPFGIAAATARSACGLEPVATSAAVRDHLAARASSFAPVLDVDLRRSREGESLLPTAPRVVIVLTTSARRASGTRTRRPRWRAPAPSRRACRLPSPCPSRHWIRGKACRPC